MICHGGDPAGGHYSCYTNEHSGQWQWYLHNDHVIPNSIGKYHLNNEPKEMQGVTAILFEKIDNPPIPWNFWEMGTPPQRTEEEEREHAAYMASKLKREENENPVNSYYEGSGQKRFPAPRSPSSSSKDIFPTPSKPIRKRSPSKEDIFPTPLRKPIRQPDDGWIRLKNESGTDCFLNASLQCLRTIPDLARVLHEDKATRNQADRFKEGVLEEFHKFLSSSGTFSTVNFRNALREVLDNLPRSFLDTQQDAGEIIIKIFHELLPMNISKMFSTRRVVWRRCRNDVNGCKVRKNE